MAEPVTLVSLGLVAAVGAFLTYFAYELAGSLLRLAGAVGGLVAGVVVGVVILPGVTGGESSPVFVTLVAVVGAVLGGVLVPALGRVALGTAGFVATALATLVVFTQGRAFDALLNALPADLAGANPVAVLERFAGTPALRTGEFEQALLVAAALGLVGGALALLYYDVVVGVAVTGVGAGLLSAVVPVLVTVIEDGATLAETDPTLSPVLTLVAFVTGIGFQAIRHTDDVDLTAGEERRR